jgi:AcrR family transcriptional regulator
VTGKRAAQKVERETRIFRAACDLFAARGFDATGMVDIADRAGLSVGTLYNYYDSKASVLLAVLRRATRQLIERSDALLRSPPPDAEEGLNALAETYLKALIQDRDLWRNLWSAALAAPRPYESGFFEVDEVLTARLTQLAAHYQRTGRLSKRIAPAVGASALYAFYSQALMAYLWDDRITTRRLLKDCRAATSAILHGLSAARIK